MSRHTTTFEDDRLAGYTCDDSFVDAMLDAGDSKWRTCPRCGAQLRLIWNVWIEELPAGASQDTEKVG